MAFSRFSTPVPFHRDHAGAFSGHCFLLGAVAVPTSKELVWELVVLVPRLPKPMNVLNWTRFTETHPVSASLMLGLEACATTACFARF